MRVDQYQTSPQENALGSSLEILKSSGDKFFRKIHRMEIPKSGSAISPSLGASSFSRSQVTYQISKASQAMRSSLQSLKSSSEKIIEKMPKINTSNNALGKSYKSLKVSGDKIFEKISKPSRA